MKTRVILSLAIAFFVSKNVFRQVIVNLVSNLRYRVFPRFAFWFTNGGSSSSDNETSTVASEDQYELTKEKSTTAL